jgi:beta propeller repeat protein
VVWEDYRNGNSDIYLYDIANETEIQITKDTADQKNPDISNGYIVWRDTRGQNSDIYIYDIAKGEEKRIAPENSYQGNPAVYAGYVVYADNRHANNEIFMYVLSTQQEIRITADNAWQQENPDIDGSNIVWEDYREGNSDILLYDFSTKKTQQIASSLRNELKPAISGNKIVWQEDGPDSNIFLYEIPPPPVAQLRNKVQSLINKGEIKDQEVKDSILWILNQVSIADKNSDQKSAVEGINTLINFIGAQKTEKISKTAASNLIKIAKETINKLKP